MASRARRRGWRPWASGPGKPSAVAAGLSEAGGGLLLALGVAPPAAAGAMAGAVAVHRESGFFATEGGYEHPAYLGFVAASLGLSGAGRYSFDNWSGCRLDRPAMILLAFGASAAAAAAVVGRREKALAAAGETAGTE